MSSRKAKKRSSVLIAITPNRELEIRGHGRPEAALKPNPDSPHGLVHADIDWLARHRISLRGEGDTAVDLLRRIRDEDWR
jgi:hypothetical protein